MQTKIFFYLCYLCSFSKVCSYDWILKITVLNVVLLVFFFIFFEGLVFLGWVLQFGWGIRLDHLSQGVPATEQSQAFYWQVISNIEKMSVLGKIVTVTWCCQVSVGAGRKGHFFLWILAFQTTCQAFEKDLKVFLDDCALGRTPVCWNLVGTKVLSGTC